MKHFIYDWTNQNTLAAWIREDMSNYEEIKVYDNYGRYEWQRDKSNENVRGDIKDGKGFSFFFARYAYLDSSPYEDESFVTNNDNNYNVFLARISFNSLCGFETLKNNKNLTKKLTPTNSVLLIINMKENSNRIISATYTNNEKYVLNYMIYQAQELIKTQDFHKTQQGLKEGIEKQIKVQLYDQLMRGYEQFQNFLQELHEN